MARQGFVVLSGFRSGSQPKVESGQPLNSHDAWSALLVNRDPTMYRIRNEIFEIKLIYFDKKKKKN